MHAAMHQQLVGGMTIRRNRGSVGSVDGGRLFNDAVAWIAQQKVSTSYFIDNRIKIQQVFDKEREGHTLLIPEGVNPGVTAVE